MGLWPGEARSTGAVTERRALSSYACAVRPDVFRSLRDRRDDNSYTPMSSMSSDLPGPTKMRASATLLASCFVWLANKSAHPVRRPQVEENRGLYLHSVVENGFSSDACD